MRDYNGQPAFRRLLVWLKANDGSGYGCIELNSFAAIEDFIGELRTRSQKKIVEINYSRVHPDENKDLIVAEHQYLTMENYRKKFGDDAILVITHLAETIDSSNEREVTALINEINMNRENYVNYPSQVLFVFPVWFMDRIYKSAHDFKSMIGFHADLTRMENEEASDESGMMDSEPNRPAPNRKMMDTYREDFENEALPINHRLEAGKKYIDVCTYYYFLDEEEISFIRKILDSFDQNRGRNEKIKKLDGEVRKMLAENHRTREAFGDWTDKPTISEKTGTNEAEKNFAAEEKDVQILKEQERLLRRELLNLTQRYAELAKEQRDMSRYQEALRLDEQVLKLRECVLPGNHHGMAESYNSISADYYRIRDYNKSMECAKKALAIGMKVLPEDHPDLVKYYSNVGSNYGVSGDYDKALDYTRKSMEISEKMLPGNHPALGRIYDNMGIIYEKLGDYQEALNYYEKALTIRKDFPKEHELLLLTERNLARLKKKMKGS
jgi:tetratricopeptide (TPR) repeat protein